MWPNCIRNFPLKGKCREYLDVHNSEITIKSNNLDYNCYYNLRTVKIFQHKGRTKQKIFEGVSSPGTGDDSSSTLTLRTLLNRILLLLIWISLSPLSRCGCWLERIILVPIWDTKIKKYIDVIFAFYVFPFLVKLGLYLNLLCEKNENKQKRPGLVHIFLIC